MVGMDSSAPLPFFIRIIGFANQRLKGMKCAEDVGQGLMNSDYLTGLWGDATIKRNQQDVNQTK